MKKNDFSKYLTQFFISYLPGQVNVSTNTIRSYKDTFKLLLIFFEIEKYLKPEKIYLRMLDKELIENFLEWLEKERRNSVATRNQRLAAINSFVRYVQKDNLENFYELQKVLAIPYKRKGKQLIHYLTGNEMKILLEQPNIHTKTGRRDLVLLVVLYDTAARVQELVDLKRGHIRISVT